MLTAADGDDDARELARVVMPVPGCMLTPYRVGDGDEDGPRDEEDGDTQHQRPQNVPEDGPRAWPPRPRHCGYPVHIVGNAEPSSDPGPRARRPPTES